MKTISLNEAWAERERLRAERLKSWAEKDKLLAEAKKLLGEADKRWPETGAKRLLVEMDKLQAETNTLWVWGDKFWDAAVKAHGRSIADWLWRSEKNGHACRLDNGETFEPIQTRGGN